MPEEVQRWFVVFALQHTHALQNFPRFWPISLHVEFEAVLETFEELFVELGAHLEQINVGFKEPADLNFSA
jgi:hypothetical protein